MTTTETTSSSKPNIVTWILFGALAAILLIHLTLTLQIGYVSDDFKLLESAAQGTKLWHLHYSLPFQFLWECSAAGTFGALQWRLLALTFHGINIALVYYMMRREMGTSLNIALFAAVLTAMNPAGVEALAWSCSAGYVLTSTWLLVGLALLFAHDEHSSPAKTTLLAILLAILQIVAYLTWDWGVLLFAVVGISALAAKTPWNRPFDVLKLSRLLDPIAVCWFIGFLWRSTSQYGTGWQHNTLLTKIKFLLGSPLLGLFPNFHKEFYSSPAGIACSLALLAFLVWTATRNRFARAMLLSYFLCIMPWALGGNPSGRYFYIPMCFLYIVIALGFQQWSFKLVPAGIVVLTAAELYLSYQRTVMWQLAYRESQSLKGKVEQIAATSKAKTMILNVPDAYGPETMSMRPQMWYCGFQTLFPDVVVLKSKDCPFVWKPAATVADRSEAIRLHQDKQLFEVVERRQDYGTSFDIVPL